MLANSNTIGTSGTRAHRCLRRRAEFEVQRLWRPHERLPFARGVFPRLPLRAARCFAVVFAFCGAPMASHRAFAQNASISGAVLLDPTERPLANAEISFPDLKLSTRSDDKGNFALGGLPAGKHALLVRLVGYDSYSADVTFGATQKLDIDVLLKASTTKLQPVDVKARNINPRLAEFDERRLSPSGGRFFTQDVFEKSSGSKLTDILLARIPGIRRVNVEHTFTRPLAGRSTTKYNCFLQIVVNGMTVQSNSIVGGGNDVFYYDIDALSANDIIGAEYYTVATTPNKFNATGAPCGTIVLWTK